MKKVMRKLPSGVVYEPSLGLAAAPEMAIAVPRVTPSGPPYPALMRRDVPAVSVDLMGRYPANAEPPWSGVSVMDSALRCCHARLRPAARLSVTLSTCIGGVHSERSPA